MLCGVWAVLAAVAVTSSVGFRPHALPQITARGSPYEIGRAIGEYFEHEIRHFMKISDLDYLLKPFYETQEGFDIVTTFYNTVNSTFPMYLDELRGIADGASVNFTELFLLNVDDEISLYTEAGEARTTLTPSCSDLLLGARNMYGHNEDGGTNDINGMFLQTAEFDHSYGLASFTFYTYPAALAGNAFGINSMGVTISSNAVFPRNLDLNGVPRVFLNRDVINGVSIEVF